MKWIAISGSWQIINKKVEKDVRDNVREIISRGDGIVTGGAINVDFVVTDEVMKLNPNCERIKVFIPTTLKEYSFYYLKKAKDLVVSESQAKLLISQLKRIKEKGSLIENKENKIISKESYYKRNSEIIEAADELIAFHVNNSPGTEDAINKACDKKILIKVFKYSIE